MLLAVTVRVNDSGLPAWQEAILSVVGVLLAVGLLWGIYKLFQLPKERRFRRRVAAVEAAAGADPVFSAEHVKTEAARLFHETKVAYDAADRNLLALVTDDQLAADWAAALDGDAANGERFRVDVRKGPRVDYVGLHGSTDGHPGEFVRVRMRAKLRCNFEKPDGTRRQVVALETVDEFWTLSRRDGRWIVFNTRGPEFAEEFLTEEIVTPRR